MPPLVGAAVAGYAGSVGGRQLDLFAPAGVEPADKLSPADEPALRALAERLPPHVRFGTSSWTFPGWAGIVYPGRPSERELKERGLELYARHPLFRTVGIDRSFYRPLDAPTLERYAAGLPPGFPCVSKVWSGVTAAVDPRTREPNPGFFDAALFESSVLRPMAEHFAEHAGPFVFELSPLRRRELPRPGVFEKKLDAFLAALPGGFSYAVELRNRELFTHAYLDVLGSRGVGHVLSFWERMPSIGEQLDAPDVLTAPFVVSRLLIPPGERYADRKRDLAPFDRIVDPQEQMRADVVRLCEACALLGKVLFVIVNNKAEGSSPLTIRALAERLAEPRDG